MLFISIIQLIVLVLFVNVRSDMAPDLPLACLVPAPYRPVPLGVGTDQTFPPSPLIGGLPIWPVFAVLLLDRYRDRPHIV